MNGRIFLFGACFAAALPGATLATGLQASVGGYMNAGFGVANPENAGASFGVFRDGEIHFHVKGELDNGVIVQGRVELEAWTQERDQIDENWLQIGGAFGNLMIGGNDTALSATGDVGVLEPSGGFFNYYDGTENVVPGDPGGAVGKNDSVGIRYWHEFQGFEFAASYQPSARTDGGSDSNDFIFKDNDQWALAGAYERKFGEFGFAVGGGYLWNDDLRQARAGIGLSYAGFSVAGFYDREEEDPDEDLNRYGVGAMYETGPWAFGGGYTLTDYRGGRGEDHFAHLGGAYDLAPGVTFYGAGQWGKDSADTEGFGAFTWLNVRF